MTSCTGWILDVYIEEDQAILWIKTEEDNTLKLMDCYEPYFYIEPKSEKDGMELFQVLRDMELIKELRWEYKFTDINNNVSQKLLCIGTYLIHKNGFKAGFTRLKLITPPMDWLDCMSWHSSPIFPSA
jgi:hypothetical protein